MTVRTRFAPSPTGQLHLGNVRAAAFNWLFARRHGGTFVLRIEDTDVARDVAGGEDAILEDLRWLGLDWDEGPGVEGPHGPYRQSAREDIYRATLDRLTAAGRAYACFCSQNELEADPAPAIAGVRRYSGRCRALGAGERAERIEAGEPHVVRLAVPDGLAEVVFEDEVFGSIAVPGSDLDDFVLRRTDGRVTYNFAVVVDDLDMRISHVIRGVGHLSNTQKQALLFDALDQERPAFAHLPTVLGPGGGKLSKRTGATPVAELRALGYPPDAVLNYLSLLGWSHPEAREVLGRSELVEAISLERVGKSDTRLDPEKFVWIAAQHVAGEDLDSLVAHVEPFLDRARFPVAADDLAPSLEAIRTRLSLYGDVNEGLELLFPVEGPELTAARRSAGGDPAAHRLIEAVLARLASVELWAAEELESAVRETGQEVGVRGATLFHPLRKALIGSHKGPELGKILAAVGRTEGARRLREALAGEDSGGGR